MRLIFKLCILTILGSISLDLLGEEAAWPRTLVGAKGGQVTLYQPQIDRWEHYTTLEFRLAAVFELPDAEEAIPAAVRARAVTDVDLTNRQITARDIEVLEISIPSEDSEIVDRLTRAANDNIAGTRHTFSLDEVLAHFESSIAETESVQGAAAVVDAAKAIEYRAEAPTIFVSESPAVLLLFDGDPIFIALSEDSGLEFAVNTNWDVFRSADGSAYYVRNDASWLKSEALEGPWAPAGDLPDAFSELPDDPGFDDVRAHIPGTPIDSENVPIVFVSYKPAELIVLDGAPATEAIPGADFLWVTNTESDLFLSAVDGFYLYLVSGRWFEAESLAGEWQAADTVRVSGLAEIPKDHPASSVRVAIPGTPEAKEAVLVASIPSKAAVQRDAQAVTVTYNGDPEFQRIADTDVYFARNTHFDVFRVGRVYFLCFEGVWFVASAAQGPWQVSDYVPTEIYDIPPESPKHNVTYVYVYESTPDTVVVGYTSGYHGVYVSNGVVVYGTGWYYSPYVYYPAYGYPVYYGYPYSYGVSAYYNPYTAAYGRGAAMYGPYGGAGWGAAYNPSTGTYARGVSAWGPYEAGYAGRAYNPRTDTYAASYQRGNSYANWGESVVSRGDNYVRTGYYSEGQNTVRGVETSSGSQAVGVQTNEGTAYVGRDANNNVYAGSDGNVYRRDHSGWSSYNDGTWESVGRSEQSLAGTDDARSWGNASKAATADDPRAWGNASKSSVNLDRLERDWQARSSGLERSRQFDAWQRDASRFGSRRGGRSFGGRRGR